MPKNLSLDEVREILDSGNFDGLIGVVEDEKIECKAELYQLKENHQKQELAKDVAGLANAGGGVILIGARTKRDPEHFGDEIKEIRSFEQNLINTSQYQDILRMWIYPSLQQVEVLWFPSSSNSKKGIAAIFIPKQASSRRPFLLTRFIDDAGKRVEVVFGYVERKQANVIPTSIQEIHTLMRDGQRYDDLNQQFTSLEEMLGQLQQEMRAGKEKRADSDAIQLMKHRMESAREKAGLQDCPVFTLAAAPVDAIEIQEIFEGNSDTVRLIDKPPELRWAGFDLDTGAASEIVRGQLRRAGNRGKIIEVWRDGTIIFVVDGGDDHLSWGKRTKAGGPLYINPLVLIESTYLFAELSKRIYGKSTPVSKEFVYRLELGKMTVRGKPCSLIPGPVGSHAWQFSLSSYNAPASDFVSEIKWANQEINTGEIAYHIVREVYRWFGIEDDDIPYTDRVDDHVIISADKIREIKS